MSLNETETFKRAGIDAAELQRDLSSIETVCNTVDPENWSSGILEMLDDLYGDGLLCRKLSRWGSDASFYAKNFEMHHHLETLSNSICELHSLNSPSANQLYSANEEGVPIVWTPDTESVKRCIRLIRKSLASLKPLVDDYSDDADPSKSATSEDSSPGKEPIESRVRATHENRKEGANETQRGRSNAEQSQVRTTHGNRKERAKATRRGRFSDTEQLIISALLSHHKYDSPQGDGFSSVLSTEAISYRRLCELSGVKSTSTINSFFGKWFPEGGNDAYRRICRLGDAKKLGIELARLVPGDVPEFGRFYIDQEC